VFDGVCMVQTCRFKKFIKVVCRVSRLALEVVLSNRGILLIVRAICFLAIIISASSNFDLLGSPLLPFLSPFLAPFFVALDGAHWLLPGVAF
jgi:hypothetical protein